MAKLIVKVQERVICRKCGSIYTRWESRNTNATCPECRHKKNT